MAPGLGVKTPVPRTRTGCLTCRKRKVKCDELKPDCGRCKRLQRVCTWSDEIQVFRRRHSEPDTGTSTTIVSDLTRPAFHPGQPSGHNFVIEFPNLDKHTIPYIHHFITFCCRFIAYPNDNEGNPFQEKLVPLATSSPALLHAMTAISAAHLSRTQKQHDRTATHHYMLALRALNSTLSDPDVAKADSTLGACLLLCVYEITHSENCLWLQHLQGARDLILFRGGPKTTDYLTRFFSLLDVSGSLSSGTAPLLQGDYWIDDEIHPHATKENVRPWPYFDADDIIITRYHELMTFMAKLSTISAEGQSDLGRADPAAIKEKTHLLHERLLEWWNDCPPRLRDQTTTWRRLQRPRKLTVPETLEEEAISSAKSCMKGCIIYIYHILDPFDEQPQSEEVIEAISFILETAKETPEGFGLEMGLYFGLFMAGIAIFNDVVAEELIRHKLKSDIGVSIYHARRALELLEVLWKRQHQYGKKYDWRQVQNQMGIQVFIFV